MIALKALVVFSLVFFDPDALAGLDSKKKFAAVSILLNG